MKAALQSCLGQGWRRKGWGKIVVVEEEVLTCFQECRDQVLPAERGSGGGRERERGREEGRDPDDFHFPCQGDKN